LVQSPTLTLNIELEPDLTTTPDEFLCAPLPHELMTKVSANIAHVIRFMVIAFMMVL